MAYEKGIATTDPNTPIAGHAHIATDPIVIQSGEGVVPAFSLLEKVDADSVVSAAGGSNVGDGAISSVTKGSSAQEGVYSITCIETAVDGGKFSVVTPNGEQLAEAEVGVAYTSEHVNFTISDGATDFAIDDVFTITVSDSANAGKWIKADSSSGKELSEKFFAILPQEEDATSSDVKSNAWLSGEYDPARINLGAGYTKEVLKDRLRELGVHFVVTISN